MQTIYKRPLRSDELMHYGVMGMRWGVRHDPYRNTSPYAINKYRPYAVTTHRPTKGQKIRRSLGKTGLIIGAASTIALGAAVCHHLGVLNLVKKIPVNKLANLAAKKADPASLTAAGLFAGTLALGYAHVKKERGQWL